MMTCPKKELQVACNYLLRLMKAHVELSNEQINLFKRAFHDILSKRFLNHWFPATPHRGSAYRCLQTKNWRDPILKSIAERSCLPLHLYLPVIFTIWIDPGEVAVCFGDEGTWCPLYKHDTNGQIHQEYSDGEDTVSSLSSDDDVLSLTQNVNTLNVNDSHSTTKQADDSRTPSPVSKNMNKIQNEHNYSGSNLYSCQPISNDWNEQFNKFWPQQMTMSDSLLYNPGENF